MTARTLNRRAARRATNRPTNHVDPRPYLILLYRRISDDREGRELGVTRQANGLRAWAEREHPNAELDDDYCDNDLSASTRTDTERPEYNRLLLNARFAAQSGKYSRVIIAAYSDSRLTRRPRENEDLIELAEECGVEYHYLRSPKFDLNTADGREFARNAVARNAAEVERTAERIIDAKEQQVKDGVYTGGGRPFGYNVERDYGSNGLPIKGSQRLTINEPEAAAIRKAVTDFLAGVPLKAIAREWNALGFRTTGKKRLWRGESVRHVLKRGRYAQLSESYGEKHGIGQWERIIEDEELAAVRAKFNDPTRRKYHGGNDRKWLGGNLFLCGHSDCDSDMRSAGANAKGGATRYYCRAHGHCAIDAAMVDQHVLMYVASLFGLPNAVGLAVHDTSAEAARLAHEITVVEGLIEQLDTEYDGGKGELTLRAYGVQSRNLEDRLAGLAKQHAELIIPENELAGVDTADAFLSLSLERQRVIIDRLVTVTILPGTKGRQPAGHQPTDRVRIVERQPQRAAA